MRLVILALFLMWQLIAMIRSSIANKTKILDWSIPLPINLKLSSIVKTFAPFHTKKEIRYTFFRQC